MHLTNCQQVPLTGSRFRGYSFSEHTLYTHTPYTHHVSDRGGRRVRATTSFRVLPPGRERETATSSPPAESAIACTILRSLGVDYV
jgi:hypothetical protein